MDRHAKSLCSKTLTDNVQVYRFPEDRKEYESDILMSGFEKKVFLVYGDKDIPDFPRDNEDTIIFVTSKKVATKSFDEVFEFPKLKTYSNKNEVVDWIINEGKRLKIDLSTISNALFVTCGGCLRKLASEIEKLSSVAEGGKVSVTQAKELVSFSVELSPKEVVEGICEGNVRKALTYYTFLQERKDETGWIIAFLQGLCSTSLKYQLLHDSGIDDSEVSKVLGMHPFVLKSSIAGRSYLWKKDALSSSFSDLCEMDFLHKSGKDIKCRLEDLIKNLAETAGK